MRARQLVDHRMFPSFNGPPQRRKTLKQFLISAASIQTAAAALNSLATLSLAGSPPPQAVPQTSTSFTSAVGHFATVGEREDSAIKHEEDDNQVTSTAPKAELSAAGITIKNGNGKKRGTIYKCESCSKVGTLP